MDEKNKIKNLIGKFINAYMIEKNIDEIISFLYEKIIILGSDTDELSCGIDEFIIRFNTQKEILSSIGEFDYTYKKIIVQDGFAWVYIFFDNIVINGVSIQLRQTFNLKKVDSKWLIFQIHLSVPNLKKDEYINTISKRLNIVQDILPCGLAIYEYNFKSELYSCIHKNKAYVEIFGIDDLNKQKKMQDLRYNFVSEEEFKRVINIVENNIKIDKAISVIVKLYNYNVKEYKWIRLEAKKFDTKIDKYYMYVIYTDIDNLIKTKEELQVTKESLNAAIEMSNSRYFEYDILKKHVDISKATAKFLGIEEVIENYPESIFKSGLIPEEDCQTYKENIEKIKSGKVDSLNFDVRFKLPNGEYSWQRKYFTVVEKYEKKPIKVVGLMIDINYLKEIEKKYKNDKADMLEMLDSVMKSQNDYIARINLNEDVVKVYASECNFIGFEKGFNLYDIKSYRTKINSKLNKIKTEEKSFLKNYMNIYEDLEINKNYMNIFKFYDKQNKYKIKKTIYYKDENNIVNLVVYDVSDIVEQEQKVNLRLRKALDMLETADGAKTEFMARMSHDMRTPMNAVIGLAEFGIEDAKNENILNYFVQIKESSKFLLGLLNDILDMQHIEVDQIKLSYETIIVKDFLSEITTVIKQKINKKNIKFIYNYDIENKYIRIDPLRAKQVLINIISNAIKYTDFNGEIKFIVKVKRGVMLFIIEDNGVGMSKEFQKIMYEPFTQEQNKMRKFEESSGLGLAISKNLISLMKGSIRCESKINKGSKFEICIPYNIMDYIVKDKQTTVDKKKLKGKKILVFEDNNINARIIKAILERALINVDVAIDGRKGLKNFKEKKYDMILMDIRMPVMDGFEATKEIRKIDEKIPIIALSANAYVEDIQKSIKAGMNYHLSKPIDKNKLFEVIYKYI